MCYYCFTTKNSVSFFVLQVLTGLLTAIVSSPAERTVTPTCGPWRRALGSPPWSSSGSTALPAASSGRRGRTNLPWAAARASSPSVTLSRKMTGEASARWTTSCFRPTNVVCRSHHRCLLLLVGGCASTSRSQYAPPSSAWTGIPTMSCWQLGHVISSAGSYSVFLLVILNRFQRSFVNLEITIGHLYLFNF